MSTAALITLCRSGGFQVRRQGLLTFKLLQDEKRLVVLYHTTASDRRSSRFDVDGGGRLTPWDSFGIWDNRIDEPILLPPSIKYGKPIPNVSLGKVGCVTQIGQRKENEDRFNIGLLTDNVMYFAVYDGHGGTAAADFCDKHMAKYIAQCLSQEEDLEIVLTKAFNETDKEFARQVRLSKNASFLSSGTTATVALLRDSIELVVASVGDSRAILCRKGKHKRLTEDHTPERKDERERIKKCGGFVSWNSLGQPHVNGRLAMTRSIGDTALKSVGVIAEPETRRIKLQHGDDAFLVLTTDGINFIMNSQEICDHISECHDPIEAAQVIVEQALQYGAEDNSTAVVVPFGAWGKHKNAGISFSFSRSFVSSGRFA
ncbi:protein phosphatase 1K, mitochondrial [Hypanus sabinus]|uniref:protein phosphatase 1K, mitochondrial n=1 Tax=Hypanus sabinus TaxID=79690 RepID=UPI0028C40C76|nr:protein phosphatase 1K, mitochondrial [Hypanus sabinus]XP_059821385.1 protein phosphatase 1K, mitochondrial [Hypanus sabinus]XP_059821386.1 protein phosphatase 1K, mitochondrial [Hypanus sabinus]